MELKKVISLGFELYVKDKFKNHDVQNFLLRHERRELFETNMARELKASYHVVKDAQTFKYLVKDCSALFCKVAIDTKELELRRGSGETN